MFNFDLEIEVAEFTRLNAICYNKCACSFYYAFIIYLHVSL